MNFDRFSLTIGLLLSAAANAQDWQTVTGQAALTEIVSDARLEGTLKGYVTAVARYNADGTAVLEAWGDAFERLNAERDVTNERYRSQNSAALETFESTTAGNR